MPFEPRVFSGDDAEGLTGADYRDESAHADERARASIADDAGELPDDLAELADQLSLDADHLAACYPAGLNSWASFNSRAGLDSQGRPAPVAADKITRFSRVKRRWLGAAAILVAGLGVWSFNRLASAPDQPAAHPVAAIGAPRPEMVSSDTPTAVASHPAHGDRARVKSPAASGVSMPAALFQELSGPEQEAVLDLLETDGNQQQSGLEI